MTSIPSSPTNSSSSFLSSLAAFAKVYEPEISGGFAGGIFGGCMGWFRDGPTIAVEITARLRHTICKELLKGQKPDMSNIPGRIIEYVVNTGVPNKKRHQVHYYHKITYETTSVTNRVTAAAKQVQIVAHTVVGLVLGVAAALVARQAQQGFQV